MIENYKFICKDFNELNIFELYEIVKARYEVFVCEQEITCENDFDDKDKVCKHLFVIDEEEGVDRVIGYCRLLPPGLSYDDASIGRVLVINDYRNKGIARKMIIKAIEEIKNSYPESNITLSAQSYIKNLYISVGFDVISDEYEEARIPHVKMKFRI